MVLINPCFMQEIRRCGLTIAVVVYWTLFEFFVFFWDCPTQVIRPFNMSTFFLFERWIIPELLINKVEKLIHLRYLKLSCFDLKELPESRCNLQSLDVTECSELEKLPQGVGKLINLRWWTWEISCLMMILMKLE